MSEDKMIPPLRSIPSFCFKNFAFALLSAAWQSASFRSRLPIHDPESRILDVIYEGNLIFIAILFWTLRGFVCSTSSLYFLLRVHTSCA